MKKCTETYQIFDYLENKLHLDQKLIFENHLRECKDCIGSLGILKTSLEIIEKQKQIAPNPYFVSHVEARLIKKELWRIHLYKRVLQPVFIFTIVLISLAGGYFLTSSFQSGSNSVSSLEYQDYVVQEPIELAFQNE